MIVIIQCAAGKRSDAGHLVTCSGKLVEFVASPKRAPHRDDMEYALPDGLREDGTPWRKVLQDYNQNAGDNPLRLYRAFELYRDDTYRRLAEVIGIDKLYILSAGWGLIRSDFLTPQYDITFNSRADAYKRRRKADHFDDYRMLSEDTRDEIVFFGGISYLPLFCSLTDMVPSRKVVFFNSKNPPPVSGCELRRFQGATRRTNWHYDCAKAFIHGTVRI